MKKATAKTTTGNARPLTLTQRVEQLNRFREQYNPLRGLTLRRAVDLAESYFRGEMADLQWTYFFIEQTDADLLGLLEMRFGRLLEMEWKICASEDADESLAENQKAFLRAKFDLIDNLNEAIEHLGMAAFRGYSHAEKIVESGQLTHLEIVDQWNAVRNGLRGEWKYNPEAKQTTFAGLPPQAVMPPEQFLYREVRRPINRIALFKFVRANLAEKDWDAFVEIFGFLGGVVIGPPNVPEDKAAAFESAAQKIAEGGSGFIPNGGDYKPNETAKGAHPFKERLDHLTEKLILAGTGGKLTMLTESGSGTLAGGAHAEVFQQVAAGDARRISEVFNRQLVDDWLDEGFPGQPHVAYFELAADEETDTAAVIDEILKLSQAGYQIDEKEVSERTGYSVTLKPAPAAPSPFGAPFGQQVQNRAGGPAREVVFRTAALAKLSEAQAKTLAPLANRIAAIANLPEDRIDSALTALRADLPKLYRDVLADGQTRAAFEEILATALVSGAAEGRAAIDKTQPTSMP